MSKPEATLSKDDSAPRAGLSFAPSVLVPEGHTVIPAGWMWVIGFALGGCEWAIREADTDAFTARIRQWAKERNEERLTVAIAECERRLAELREELRIT